MGYLALPGAKYGNIPIILVLVDLVVNGLPGTHSVPTFWVVGTPPHTAPVLLPLNHFLGEIEVLGQLDPLPRHLHHFGQVLHRAGGLFFQIGTDVHIIPGAFAVWRHGTHGVKGDKAVLSGAPPQHTEEGIPPGQPRIPPIGAVPKGHHELLPGEQTEGEILLQLQIVGKLHLVGIDVLGLKAFPNVCRQCLLLRRHPIRPVFHQLDVLHHFRNDLTGHPRPPAPCRPWPRCP